MVRESLRAASHRRDGLPFLDRESSRASLAAPLAQRPRRFVDPHGLIMLSVKHNWQAVVEALATICLSPAEPSFKTVKAE